MNSKSLLALAALAAGPVAGLAQMDPGGYVLGDNTRLFILQSAEYRYDDNVSFAERDAQDDFIFIYTPGLELNYDAGIAKGVLTASCQAVRYDSFQAYDRDLLSVVGDYSYQGAVHRIRVQGGYREYSQATATIRNREQALRQNLTNASLEDLWAYSAKTKVGVGLTYDATDYTSRSYSDRETYGVPLDVYFAASPKLDLSLGYRYRHTNIDRPPTSVGSLNTVDHFINVGARGDFTPKLNGQIRVGYGIRDFSAGGTKGQLGLLGGLTYVYSPKTSFDLTVSNDFSNSELGTSQEVLNLRLAGRFEFNPQWSAQLGLGWQSIDYSYVPAAGFTFARNDDFYVADFGVVYAMNEVMSFRASYTYRENSSNRAGLDFDNNLLSFGASLRF